MGDTPGDPGFDGAAIPAACELHGVATPPRPDRSGPLGTGRGHGRPLRARCVRLPPAVPGRADRAGGIHKAEGRPLSCSHRSETAIRPFAVRLGRLPLATGLTNAGSVPGVEIATAPDGERRFRTPEPRPGTADPSGDRVDLPWKTRVPAPRGEVARCIGKEGLQVRERSGLRPEASAGARFNRTCTALKPAVHRRVLPVST